MKMLSQKKGIVGQLSQLVPAAMIVIVIIIAIVLGSKMLQTVSDTQATGSYAANASIAGQKAFKNFADYFDIITLVIVVVVIIALLMGAFMVFGRGGQ